MLILVGALLASYLVPLALYFYLRSAHKDDKDYKKDCWNLLWNGLMLGFPVFGFSLLCYILFKVSHISDRFPIIEVFFSAFILKAFSEELMKYLLANKTIRKNHANLSFLDLMAFTTISAIGFELMEAVVYMFESNVPQILVRGITNMHAVFGLIMGYIIAKGYKKGNKNPVPLGIFVSTMIHGIYDLCLDEAFDATDWGMLSLLIAFICLIINIVNYIFMNKARKDPYYTDPLFPEENIETIPQEETV